MSRIARVTTSVLLLPIRIVLITGIGFATCCGGITTYIGRC